MDNSEKRYRIAGHDICVRMEAPWAFRPLSEGQKELVERLRRGEDVGVESVPAGREEQLEVNDAIMEKDVMTREKWENLDSESREEFRNNLDMLQYAPFEVAGCSDSPLFTLSMHRRGASPKLPPREGWELQTAVDDLPPFYYGYTCEGKTIYEFYTRKDCLAGTFVLNSDYSEGDYYPAERAGVKTTLMQLNTSLMIQYTFATAPLQTLLLHASVTRYRGKANLFFGVSGTGKSTHSLLWHQYVPESDLMNDDNPVIRFSDGEATVYGTPWSGKTICYRNTQAPVRALVRLEQEPQNHIERLQGIQAYASVIAAVSTIRWNPAVMDMLIPSIEKAATLIPCFRLGCRADREAVEVCREALESL